MARPLIIATNRKPAGNVRKFVEFVLGPEGQQYVEKTGHLPNSALTEKK